MITLSIVQTESQAAESLIARWVTAEDHIRAKQRRNEEVRQNFLLARASLRALLSQVTGSTEWQIYADAKGKPHTLTPTGLPGPHISLSHTRGLVACAVCRESPLGIDVEYWRSRDFVALANYAFGPREREEVARDGASAFYRIWTLREAMAKTTGQDILASIDGDDRIADAPASGCWTKKSWQLFYNSPQTDCSLAIASQGESGWSEASLTWIDITSTV